MWTDVRMVGRTSETHMIRSTQKSRPNTARQLPDTTDLELAAD